MCNKMILGFMLSIALPVSLAAQYGGGGGMGGAGSGSGGYTAPKSGYSSGTGIAIGAAAAAGVGVALLAFHYHGLVTGCVEPSTNGEKLMDEKSKNTYSLAANSLGLKPGERVKLKGKKEQNSAGAITFAPKKLVKDLGPCKQMSTLHAAGNKLP
jgi:hypothetical protein